MTPPQTRKVAGTRRDIQALRALAVGEVVLNHLWPLRMSGGYVGVDVFFVISGFLISAHILKELGSTGRIRLGAFYARRIMRLLPAAFLVISVSAVASWRILPFDQWTENAKEFLAAALYSENWVLAARSINYSAQTQAETVMRHYWSLSVEEQFYLVWPLLLLVVTLLARRRSPKMARALMVGTLSVVAVVFLLVSIGVTQSHPAQAYFITPTRMWEFAVGGIVAVIAPRLRMPRAAAELLALIGFVAIIYTSFAYGPNTPFPGWTAAVPVLGTALIIAAGTRDTPLLHERLTGLRPIQFLGDISYSVYLWHWPLVVLVPAAQGHELGWRTKLIIVAVSVLLAWLTKVFVEDPGRRWVWPKARTWRAFATMAAGILVTGAISLSLIPLANAQVANVNRIAKMVAAGGCAGPRALTVKGCPNPYTTAVVNPIMTDANSYWNAPAGWCRSKFGAKFNDPINVTCDDSNGNPKAPTVWLIGDSHAQEWLPAILRVAHEQKWKLRIALHMACPAMIGNYVSFPYPGIDYGDCMRWAKRIQTEVTADRPALVLTAALTRLESLHDGTGHPQLQQMTDALHRMWKPWVAEGVKVMGIADPPLNDPHATNIDTRGTCLVANPKTPTMCAGTRHEMDPIDPMVVAPRSMPGTSVINMTDKFCDAQHCYAAIGGIRIYFDINHVNYDYMSLLTPSVARQIKAFAPALFTRPIAH